MTRAPATTHADALTGLRGCAAGWVLIYHVWVLATPRRMSLSIDTLTIDVTPFFSAGWAGVQMFFVLSGFLLAQPFARWQAGLGAQPALGAYLWRRVRRVFPAYYAQALVLGVVLWAASGHWPISGTASVLRHLTMGFVPVPGGGEAINGIWWSLPVEFMFYLLLPLLAAGLRPQRVVALLILCFGVMVAWRHGVAVLMADQPIGGRFMVGSQMPGMLDAFGLGMAGAVLHVDRARWPAGWSRVLASPVTPLAAVAGMVACLYWIHAAFRGYWADSVVFYTWTPTFGACYLVLVLAAAHGNRLTTRCFGNRPVVWLGVVSYSVYLWHMPILDAVRRNLVERVDGYLFVPLLLAAVVAVLPVAWLSWRWVEQPFRRAANES